VSVRPRAALRAYQRVIDLACRLDVRTVIGLAGRAGAIAQLVRPRPDAAELMTLFAGRTAAGGADFRAIASEMSVRRFRSRALMALIRRNGPEVGIPLLEPGGAPGLEALRDRRAPAILVSWHVGPPSGIGATLARLGIPALGVMRRTPYQRVGTCEIANTSGGPTQRTAALWRAVQQVKDGGLVIIAADGQEGARTAEVACLGRLVTLARGPFVLARLSGAPLIPIASRWTSSGRIAVHLGDPLRTDAARPEDGDRFEHACAAAMAAWLESYFLSAPAELRLSTLRWFLSARQVEAGAASAAGREALISDSRLTVA
jgi:lauroyl/myristoyl acyltransferase